MARRRILIVLNYYSPYVSGLSEYARAVAEAMSGHAEVTVLTGRHDRALAEEEVVGGVRVVRAQPLLFLHKGYLSADLFRRFRSLCRSMDCVHFHLPMLEAGVLATWVAPETRIIATYHCDVVAVGGMIDALAVTAASFSASRCMHRASTVIVNSLDYARHSRVLRGHESKWCEVPPPSQEFAGPPPENVTDVGPRVGFLGRFVHEKGIDVLLEAFTAVVRRVPDARLILAGERARVAGGGVMQTLEDGIAALRDAVELPGRLSAAQLRGFFQSLDVLVLPSRNSYESFGMVQVEALKAGVPVIASDLPGVRVPIQKTGYGILVPPGNPQALEKALVECLEKRHTFDRAAISRAAYERFGNAAIFEKWRSIYAIDG